MNCPHCGKVIVVQLVKDDGKQAGFPERSHVEAGDTVSAYLELINLDSLSGKDYDFAADMKKKHEQYGSRMFCSDKQLAWLKRLAAGEKKPPRGADFDDVPF